MITACPLAFGETGVKGRIKSVLNYKKPAFWVVLAAVFVSIAVAVCFLTDPKTDAEQPEEEPPASSTADSPAEADSTPPDERVLFQYRGLRRILYRAGHFAGANRI